MNKEELKAMMEDKIAEQIMELEWKCNECDGFFKNSEFLRAPNPFNGDLEILGCCLCGNVDGFTNICDEEGCNSEATTGRQYADVYRRNCHKHQMEFRKKERLTG